MTITTYIDPQGKRKTGYIKNKISRPAAGIKTASDDFQKAESSPYTAYLNKGANKQYTVKHHAAGYDVKADTALTEDNIYTRQLQKNAENTKKNIADFNRSYADANTQLYRDYMTRKKTLPQALAAQGISGGMSETSLLGLESAYQSALDQNERARLAGVQEIKSAGSSNELAIMENQRLRQEEKAKEEAAKAVEMAKTMAAAGDFSGYKALGYSDEQIAALKSA